MYICHLHVFLPSHRRTGHRTCCLSMPRLLATCHRNVYLPLSSMMPPHSFVSAQSHAFGAVALLLGYFHFMALRSYLHHRHAGM
jgi:hypothetical protein